jgi:O-antigen/teichoic acid export membrane protein
MIRRSGSFWFINAMAAGVLSVDYIIMSQYLPAGDIVSYGITAKIFALAAFLYTSLYAALWPHFTEAITMGDWASVKRELKKSFLFGVTIVLMVTLILWAFMPDIIRILSPNEALLIPSSFILLFGVYHLLLAWVHGYAVILQSMSDTRVLLVWTTVQAGLSIFFQILLVQKMGMYGIVLGLILSFLLTAVWVVPKRVFHHFDMSMHGAS